MDAAGLHHERWHEVAGLRPRLAEDTEVAFQRFRGQAWTVLASPFGGKAVRVREEAYAWLLRLDGATRVDDACLAHERAEAEVRIDQSEALALLAQLDQAGLLRLGEAPDGGRVLERVRHERRAERARAAMNLLFVRIPLVRPDRWLTALEPVLGGLFSRTGLVAWTALVLLAGLWLLPERDLLAAEAREHLAFEAVSTLRLLVAFVLVKALHELGHGVACKRLARSEGRTGHVPSMGVVLIALLPVPYVDATSSWLLCSKWRRAGVALAGMMAELGLAALAALVWSSTGPGVVHAMALDVMLVAGVTTVLFNANPLVRFDGYYAFCDLAELPNLDARSRRAFGRRMRALFGLGPSGGRIEDEAWLLGYAAAAWAYRMVICFWLLIGLSGRFFGLGALLAGVGALTWLGLPLARAARSLVSEPAPEADGRLSPPLRAGLVLGGLALLLLAVPVAERGRLDGVVEPTALAAIHVREGGFVEHLAQSGSRVAPGEGVILRLASPELESRQRALEAEVALARVELRGALGRDPALTRDLDENLKVLEARLERVRERRAQLVVEAPFAGVWVAPGSDAWTGAFLPAAAEPFGVVHGDGALKVRAFADASLGPRVAASLEPGDPVELRLASRPGRRLSGALEAVVPKRADDADAWPFEVRVLLDADVDAGELLAGERVVARVALGSRPLGLQWGRSLARLLLRSGGAPGS